MTRQQRKSKSQYHNRMKREGFTRISGRWYELTNYSGIDYGLGSSNRDRENGIRFGVISMNSLHEWAWDSFEAEYGDPTCPECGNEVIEYSEIPEDDEQEYESEGCSDFACETCKKIWESDQVYGDEPVGHVMTDSDYLGHVDSYNEVWVLKSPYYTHAQFCSPCCPGAGNLDHPCLGGPRTYCLGGDFFPGDKAPYPVYSVETRKLINPE